MDLLQVAHRLEAATAERGVAYARALTKLRPEANSAILSIAGGVAIFAGAGFPVNKASGLGFSGAITAEEIDQIEAFFRERGIQPWIEVCPLAHRSLQTLLQQRGYRPESTLNVLALALKDWTAAPASAIQVREARPDEAQLWLQTVAEGFAGDGSRPEAMRIIEPSWHSATATCFLAWLDGQPAGGGALFVQQGVAGLGSASTRPAFRRRGVQTALLQFRLQRAQTIGCDLAMTITAPGSASQRNIERAGFRLAYARTVMVKERAHNTAPSLAG